MKKTLNFIQVKKRKYDIMCTSSVKMYAKEIKEATMQKDFIYENYLKMPDDLEFEQAMKVYEELLEENLEEDEIYDKLWDHALHCMIDYGSLRAHWKITPKTDRSNDDRTVMHDSVIHSLDELAAYTKEHGKEAKWREELGYQRKRIGDFACYVSLIYGVFAR